MQVVASLIFVIIITLVLSQIPNKSNFSAEYFIPVCSALLSKYAFGDWDKGYQWSASDMIYWPTLLGLSYITVKSIQ